MQVTPRVLRCRKQKTSTCENGQTNLGIISSHHFDPSARTAPTKPALARQLEPFIEQLVWSSAHARTCSRIILLQPWHTILIMHTHARGTPRITRSEGAAKKPVTKRGTSLLSPITHPVTPPLVPASDSGTPLGYMTRIYNDSDNDSDARHAVQLAGPRRCLQRLAAISGPG